MSPQPSFFDIVFLAIFMLAIGLTIADLVYKKIYAALGSSLFFISSSLFFLIKYSSYDMADNIHHSYNIYFIGQHINIFSFFLITLFIGVIMFFFVGLQFYLASQNTGRF